MVIKLLIFYFFDFFQLEQDKGILLTTYDIVRNNSKALQGANCYIDDDSEDGVTWDYMILDEVAN